MNRIVDNILKIRREIEARNPSCEIVAATKTRTLAEIIAAMDTGLIAAAGENRAQELVAKFTPDYSWDFIGRLQSNKIKYLVGRTRLIHSVDSLSLVDKIDRLSKNKGIVTDVLIEINTGREEAKGGILTEEAYDFLEKASAYRNVRVSGLMAVAQKTDDFTVTEQAYNAVRRVFDDLKSDSVRYLSMGMSDDYKIALDCGANIIRPGRIIFGERVYDCKNERGEDNPSDLV